MSLVLQGGAVDGDDRPQNFFDVLDDAEIWEPRSPIVIGASVAQGLHPVLVDALAGLVLQQSRNRVRLQRATGWTGAGPISPTARHLAGWIENRARDVGAEDAGDLSIQAEELSYFLASSGWRARGLSRTLDAARQQHECLDIVDIGGAFGLIPWLIAAEPLRRVRHVTVVDPNTRYYPAAESLWPAGRHPGEAAAFRIVPTTADRYRIDREADLVLICQTMHHVPAPARLDVLRRSWDALKPGGLLAINEVIVDDDAPDDEIVRRAYRESLRQSEISACFRAWRRHCFSATRKSGAARRIR